MTCDLTAWLVRKTALPAPTVHSLIRTGSYRYKTFFVPKRSGRGVRLIAQPARELKALQRLAVSEFLNELPIHDAVHGYVRGRGVKSNAEVHRRFNFLLKMDFRDFFPSLKPEDMLEHFRRYLPAYNVSEETLAGLFFWHPRGATALELCIGAPSSPFISNTLLFEFDSLLSDKLRKLDVIYTRYSDDLSFSSNHRDVLGHVPGIVLETLGALLYPRLSINSEKTVHTSRKRRKVVTGIIITPQSRLSIGRERKKLMRSMAHRASLRKLDSSELQKLQGLINFAHDIEPEFAIQIRGLMSQRLKSQ